MFQRLCNPLKSNSFFIFGARGTGKSTFIEKQFLQHLDPEKFWYIDLLDESNESQFKKNPKMLETYPGVKEKKFEWIVIDEVQKAPKLLDFVHRLIEKRGQKFILLGSSSRKLKKMGANLLAGRAYENKFFPLTHEEMGPAFDLEQVLKFGSLPKTVSVLDPVEKGEFLKTYVRVYVREEIIQEQLVRKIDAFRDFLPVVAQNNGKQLNFAKMSREIGIDSKTIEQYYLILEETYLGFFLKSFHFSVRKAQAVHPKFYFFDLGVRAAILQEIRDPLVAGSQDFGDYFESFLINEFYRANELYKLDMTLSFLRTKDDLEIDLILTRGKKVLAAIEIKSSQHIDEQQVKKMESLAKDINPKVIYWLSRYEKPENIGAVRCRFWKEGFQEIMDLCKA